MTTWLPLPLLPETGFCELPFSGEGVKNTSAVSRARRQENEGEVWNESRVGVCQTKIPVLGGSGPRLDDTARAVGRKKPTKTPAYSSPTARETKEPVIAITNSTNGVTETNTIRPAHKTRNSIKLSHNPLGVLPRSPTPGLGKPLTLHSTHRRATPSMPEPTSSLRQPPLGQLSRRAVLRLGRYSGDGSAASSAEGNSTRLTAKWRSNAPVRGSPRKSLVPALPDSVSTAHICELNREDPRNCGSSCGKTWTSRPSCEPSHHHKEPSDVWRFHSRSQGTHSARNSRWNLHVAKSSLPDQRLEGSETDKTSDQLLPSATPSGISSAPGRSSLRVKARLPRLPDPTPKNQALTGPNQQPSKDTCRVGSISPPGGLAGETAFKAPATACGLAESDITHLHSVRDAMDLDSPLPAADGTHDWDLPINDGDALGQASADRTAGLMDERTKQEAEILFKAFLEVENSVEMSPRAVSLPTRPVPGPTVAGSYLTPSVQEGSKSGTMRTSQKPLQIPVQPPGHPDTRALSQQRQSTRTTRMARS
ncbi:unnamed protein product [Tuber aestivum]|uniref:Uncharacterized protein n=1 Tax=Tuber aestivum TaxID=59557 RepID=A0A292PLJ4_9PEZI|nr:unnamed protein product [Tuber aestivum]